MQPGYGETPVTAEESDALVPRVRELLGPQSTKADVYDLEQAVQQEVSARTALQVFEGTLQISDLLADCFVRDLHRWLYEDVWIWAGVYRQRELNIGIAPERIAVELRESMDTIRYRWEHTADWSARALGIAVHAEFVRIHPFVDGNGRCSRLLADLVFLAAQDSDEPERYVWDLDKREYVRLLQRYDQHRDPRQLAAFVGVATLGE